MTTIEEFRAKLQQARSNNTNNTNSGNGGDNASFRFWDGPIGSTSTVRFLPDGDTDNPFFWVERQVIKLPFSGVVGGDYPTDKEVTVTVPCMDMYGKSCPIIAATKHLWKGSKEDVETARIYYKKRSFIFQGFVVSSAFEEENVPENPIRRFVINKSIYDLIYASLLEPNFENMPTDYEGGRDFKITKRQNGEWASYNTSNWSYQTRALDERERAAIDQYGLHNLKEALGAEPDDDAVDAIKAMFEDSLAGNPYDMDAYGKYYRPYTTSATPATSNVPSSAQTEKTAEVAKTIEVEAVVEKATTTSRDDAQDILQRLREKKASQ